MCETDSQIWEKILNGNKKAWTQLVGRYQSLVYTVAVRSGLRAADVADCFQQTWVALYRNKDKIKEPQRISAWLVTTAKREAIRIFRGYRNETDIDHAASIHDANPTADQNLESLELQSHLENGLKLLEPRCRKLLTVLFFDQEERSYELIARDLGINQNSLGPVRGRCLGKLKKILIENGYLDVLNK